jgi:hypothetical protein
MASGEQLRDVTFDSEVREKLAELLAPALKNRLGPADTTAAVIRRLEDVATYASAFAKPDIQATLTLIDKRARAVVQARRVLGRANLAADDMLDSELRRRGLDPMKVRENVLEQLFVFDAALGDIKEHLGRCRRNGGRPADSKRRWIVEQTSRVLVEAGIPVTAYEDGLHAKTLRILWPVVLKVQAPIELRPWLKLLKSRR